jgi:predicted nucleic acid-binding protein
MHGFSVYEAIYVSLAEARSMPVLTADAKLAARARSAGRGALVTVLAY